MENVPMAIWRCIFFASSIIFAIPYKNLIKDLLLFIFCILPRCRTSGCVTCYKDISNCQYVVKIVNGIQYRDDFMNIDLLHCISSINCLLRSLYQIVLSWQISHIIFMIVKHLLNNILVLSDCLLISLFLTSSSLSFILAVFLVSALSANVVSIIVVWSLILHNNRVSFSPVCPTGKYGSSCSKSCNANCKGPQNACHHIKGTCSYGCEDGYRGDMCDSRKSLGLFF